MNDALAAVPYWEKRWPGRLQYELDALAAEGVVPQIDQEALAAGVLVLDLKWHLDGGPVNLQIIFPDSYPDTKPEVFASELPPGRHINPIERNLCLLGRGTHNWQSNMTVAWLLREQLQKTRDAAADPGSEETEQREEHQGEPAEVWWNSIGMDGSYCLVDSEWSIDEKYDHGKLVIRYAISGQLNDPVVQAYVEQVLGPSGEELERWRGPVPSVFWPNAAHFWPNAAQLTIPWARLSEAPLPVGENAGFWELYKAHKSFEKFPLTKLRVQWKGKSIFASIRCILYPEEITWRSSADGWLFLMAIRPRRKDKPEPKIIRTFRAGLSDLTSRVPAVESLRDRRIAVIGLGAIGAPVAIELARNGCSELRIIDHDIVEPGNTVRWPLGTGAWGDSKTSVVESFIHANYPATHVKHDHQRIGECVPPGEEFEDRRTANVLGRVLNGVDLVIDATAEIGINLFLDGLCRERAIPLITAHATPTLEGGAVALLDHRRGGGCRMCLWHHWANGEANGNIPRPIGETAREESLLQPPGCSERTFRGASFDLSEISLQTVRLAIDTIANSGVYGEGSLVQILSFVNDEGKRIPPSWQSFPLPPHPGCACHRAE